MAALCYVFTCDSWFMDFAFMPVGGVDISSVQRFNFFFLLFMPGWSGHQLGCIDLFFLLYVQNGTKFNF
jgi:hypothetical protein